jgi:hypothetical protein
MEEQVYENNCDAWNNSNRDEQSEQRSTCPSCSTEHEGPCVVCVFQQKEGEVK